MLLMRLWKAAPDPAKKIAAAPSVPIELSGTKSDADETEIKLLERGIVDLPNPAPPFGSRK